MLFVEATAVEAIGRITPGCLGLYSDENERALGRVVAAIRKYSPIALGIQLAHAGRKASSEVPWRGGQLIPLDRGGWRPVAPSAVPITPEEVPPEALDRAGMRRIREGFVASTRRALRLGFDAIELHSAHGYLLHEFLSPIANRRDGRLRRIAREPDALPARGVRGGARGLARRQAARRADLLDRLGGGRLGHRGLGRAMRPSSSAAAATGSTARAAASRRSRRSRSGPAIRCRSRGASAPRPGSRPIGVGLITDTKQAEAIVASGDADMVALARGMLYDPRWAWHAAATLGGEVHAPEQYWRCPPREAGRIFGDTKLGQR